jgi:hypothetical protein
MAIRIGDEAPDFTAQTTEGTIQFHQWIGDGWAILFSHPKDFTPVCTTELGYMAGLKPEFDKRGTKIIGLSIDPVDDHKRWLSDIEETQGHALRHDPPQREPGPAHGGGQRDDPFSLPHRPRQEGQGDAGLPDERGPQFR